MSSQAWESLSPEQQHAEWQRWHAWQQQMSAAAPRPVTPHHLMSQHPAPIQTWGPPAGAPVRQGGSRPTVVPTNTAAIVGLASGIVGLFILPFLLGPVALITGAVGLDHASKNDGVGRGAAAGALVLGGINLIIAVAVLGSLT